MPSVTVHNFFVPLDEYDFEPDGLKVLRDGPVQWLTDRGIHEYSWQVQSKWKRVWFGFPTDTDPKMLMLFKLTWAVNV